MKKEFREHDRKGWTGWGEEAKRREREREKTKEKIRERRRRRRSV